MSVKNVITQEFLTFQQLHTIKNDEAKKDFHKIFYLIVDATRKNALTLADAENLIDILFVLYDTLESRI